MLLKGWQKALAAFVLLAAAGVLAHLHVAAQVYYPVVRIASPDGLVLTALQDETPDRRKCGEANARFIEPVRAYCQDCKVLYARCARELGETETRLLTSRPMPFPVMLSIGLRLGIEGPAGLAQQTCQFIAADLLKRGFRGAVCIPASAAGK